MKALHFVPLKSTIKMSNKQSKNPYQYGKVQSNKDSWLPFGIELTTYSENKSIKDVFNAKRLLIGRTKELT